ncbi:hypothetical protein FIBSPDRAFT_722184 [Athelia psychrophila]|uniref:Uncharacterized protein n=1 Tax=Athelia psychrophila TaxID=1759441 RepID=A0A166VL67_9AGAM|nr:hypothetical protein FIBSPDRAFT_722184 [Fibularhizoctonia sp. CBS 109695]
MSSRDPSDATTGSSSFLSQLTKLRDDGSNWITGKERIETYLASKRLWRHVDGSARKPPKIKLLAASPKGKGPARTSLTATEEQLEKVEKAFEDWIEKEAQARQVLYHCISDRRLLEVKNCVTVAEVWKKLCSMHEQKPQMVAIDKRRYLQNM